MVRLLPLFLLLSIGCSTEQVKRINPEALFQKREAAETGITFENRLQEDTVFNILNYLYYFNGGGVAVGDLNGDSLPDLYFTANQAQNHCYLNLGNFEFRNISEATGLGGSNHWSTGVSMADVNGDGLLDLYLCYAGNFGNGESGKNQLFVNQGVDAQGIPQFEEQAERWGVAFSGLSTQAYFFDYDVDGDLDLYLLNHSVHTATNYAPADRARGNLDPKAGDRLYRNDGGRFTDVSAAAGIRQGGIGYGLSASVEDFNLDGLPDLYICNDFHEDDYLYLNQGDGTFSEALRQSMGHTSRFSMGSDAADLNNDGLPDLLTLDMKPEVEAIRKTAQPEDAFDIYQYKLSYGYYHQLARNALQLHQGFDAAGNPQFSEVGQLAGLPATDWSWGALMADFDLDGLKDIFITNGIWRRPNDMDYIKYISDNSVKRSLNRGVNPENLKVILEMPQVPQPNYAFRNRNGWQFESVATAWGLDEKGYANGVAYADLDADGDLDLAINNLNATAGIYQNRAVESQKGHFLKLKLQGRAGNQLAVGAKAVVFVDGHAQHHNLYLARGFQSSVAPALHFGLGRAAQIDSLWVIWPNGDWQRMGAHAADQTLSIAWQRGLPKFDHAQWKEGRVPLLQMLDAQSLGLDFVHQENNYIDFNREPLMFNLLSTEGPASASADLDGDGREEVFIGGASGQPSVVFRQLPNGQFERMSQPALAADAAFEDVAASFFDANGDGLADLFVGSGGGQYPPGHPLLADRLYLNQGNGKLQKSESWLPTKVAENTACVAPADFDGDGDIDLFVGSRSVSGSYGLVPKSFLLRNDGQRFEAVTSAIAPDLVKVGMLTDALWHDWNGDGQLDLTVAGHWMPPTIFWQKEGRFVQEDNAMGQTLQQHPGLWNDLQPFDADGDGDQDLLAANWGLNTDFTVDTARPLELFVKDFDLSGNVDPLLAAYRKNAEGEWRSYPYATRDELIDQMTFIRKLYPTYKAFSEVTITQLFPEKELRSGVYHKVTQMASGYFENLGSETGFRFHPFSPEAQVSPIMAAAADDLSADGLVDVLLVGNFYGVQATQGRYDALKGLLLQGSSEGFRPLSAKESGLMLQGEYRAILPIGTDYWLLFPNNGAPTALKRNRVREG